jgi:diguanylate cyclase (GGDEF)-like protein
VIPIGARVLVVDDDSSVVALVRLLAEQEGLEVTTAADGLTAVRDLESADYDLVVLDLGLPGATGDAVLAAVRSAERHRTTQVLVLSGTDDTSRLRQVLDAGGQDFVRKPFEPEELLGRMSACLRTKAQLDALVQTSVQDVLTGLLNRRGGEQELQRWAEHCQRSGEPLSVLMIDIDRFKSVNDRLGHAAGDAVLQEVAARLLGALRQSDLLARWGGEEFLAILPGTSGPAASELSERLAKAVAFEPLGGEHAVSVTISAGWACTEDDAGSDLDVLVSSADRRLYAERTKRRAERQASA